MQEEIDLLITDIKMPAMGGFQLLKEVKRKYPSTMRLVLSRNVDVNTLFKIKNNCLAKLYLFKQWQNRELIRIIENIFSVEKVLISDIYSWNIISKDRIIEIDDEVLKNLGITKVEGANLLEEIKTAIL